MTDIRLIYVTTKDLEEARALSRELLDRKLIACANMIPGMESIYSWQGAIETANEVVLILKTKSSQVQATIQAVEELHSYETPCALEIKIESGSSGYIDWLKAQT